MSNLACLQCFGLETHFRSRAHDAWLQSPVQPVVNFDPSVELWKITMWASALSIILKSSAHTYFCLVGSMAASLCSVLQPVRPTWELCSCISCAG